jgi:hypothetical protein
VRVAVVGTVALCAALAGGRLRHRGPDPAPSGIAPPAGAEVRYSVAWSWEGATWNDAHHSYSFRSDRGYTVRLEAGYLGTASFELVPCQVNTAPAPPVQRAFLDLLLPAAAYANHGYAHDASLVQAPAVESLLRSGAYEFGVGHTSGVRYCQLHELLVPLDQQAEDGFHLDHWSAFIRGAWTLPNGGEEHAFAAHVNLRGGALVDLPEPHGAGPFAVRVTRSAVHAFDGVTLEKLSSSELAYAFLRGLTKGTRAAWE